ncbi:hypothetical protein HDV00_011791 [Rhizophlyctis rosea]|nr:hypothetical protein HDV00_011791 [Rhizophlyctis rosea]
MGKKGPRGPKHPPASQAGHSYSSTFTNFGNFSTSDLLHLTLTTSTTPTIRSLRRFTRTHKILLIGEGDFSFAQALATALGTTSNITATSFDSQSDVFKKYPSARDTLQQLKSKIATILHSIDARTLSQNSKIASSSPFDRIVFNFPHVGGSQTEDVAENQALLSDFFAECLNLLSPNGEIHVALRETPFYARWEIEELANGKGLKLKEKVGFENELFSSLGYAPQRTNPAVRAAPTLENASVYVFVKAAGDVMGPSVAKVVDPSEKQVSGSRRKVKRASHQEDRGKSTGTTSTKGVTKGKVVTATSAPIRKMKAGNWIVSTKPKAVTKHKKT